jgi:hypothetical protein
LTWTATAQEARRIETLVQHILNVKFGTLAPLVTISDLWALLGDRTVSAAVKLRYNGHGGDDEFNASAVTFYNKLMVGWPVDPTKAPKDDVAACGAELQTVLATAGGQHTRPMDHALQKALDEGTALLK